MALPPRYGSGGGVTAAAIAAAGGLLADGSVAMTGDLSMGDKRITGLKGGTPGSPAVTFAGDGNTGLYRPSSDVIALTAGGVQQEQWPP